MNTQPYYPIGIQDFSEIRKLNALYIDKTALVHKLISSSKYAFLSRPRRFGKSLLSSTLQYYFEGKKDLFAGLAIERLETEWKQYPVLHFDLSTAKCKSIELIEDNISGQIRVYEESYGISNMATAIGDRLENLISEIYEKTGNKVVVIVDEYDTPILDAMPDNSKCEQVRNLLREFYAPLKPCDKYLRFVFLTGISMFSQLSIFSELNNLNIISRNEDYAAICGITEQELVDNFQHGISKLAAKYGCTNDEMVLKLKNRYDGYHFSDSEVSVYNPYSLLNAFFNCKLESYWYRSGTPTFLVEMLKKYNEEGKFRLEQLESDDLVDSADFETPLELQTGPLPLLYQAGYLTIKNYYFEDDAYTLCIPNAEVRVGLMKNLMSLYADVNDVNSISLRASTALRKGDIDRAMQQLQAMLASIPFMKGDKNLLANAEKTEAHYHRIFYIFFRMLTNDVNAEVRNATGTCDVLIKTPNYIYVVEIKIDATADNALKQIEGNGYAEPYLADGRKVIKLGVNFSTETRTLSEWHAVSC